jgi:DNA-binding GntR family transcriptional regulator
MGSHSQPRPNFERRRPLVLEVRDELERIILDGELAGGERLDETTLAELMGVSRGPVREAARSLEREGLVTAIANRGVFVRKLSLAETLELYDLRAMMAGYLCAELARVASRETLSRLHDFLDRMDEAIADRDESGYFSLNLEFHDFIAAVAERPRACALYTGLGKEVRLFRLRVLNGAAALELSNSEHRRIVAAIEARDAGRAEAEGSQHHLNGKRRLLETLAETGEEREQPFA